MTEYKLPQPDEQVQIESIAKALYKYRKALNTASHDDTADDTKESLKVVIDSVEGPNKPEDVHKIEALKNEIVQVGGKLEKEASVEDCVNAAVEFLAKISENR